MASEGIEPGFVSPDTSQSRAALGIRGAWEVAGVSQVTPSPRKAAQPSLFRVGAPSTVIPMATVMGTLWGIKEGPEGMIMKSKLFGGREKERRG